MPLPIKHVYTIEDIFRLPDGERAELIDENISDYTFSDNVKANIYEDLYIDFSETENFL